MSAAGRARRAGSLLFMAAAAIVLAGAVARPPSGPDLAASSAKPPPTSPVGRGNTPRTVQLPSGHPLPDTVLALVDQRVVTVADFRNGWRQVLPPARSDTLTPASARQFLELLIDKELLAARASQETWEWSAVESAQVAGLRDRTTMRVALDSVLAANAAARAARGEPPLDPNALGVAARESTVARLEASYDELLLERLARSWGALPKPSADSSIWSRLKTMGQMPAIELADSGRVVAWSSVGTVRVTDLLDAWAKLNPMFRPRVETVEQVRDLAKNAMFERVLRRQAQQGHYERHPAVLRAVQRQEDYLASQYFVSREVFSSIPLDEPTLRRYYDRDPVVWAIPTRLSVVRMVIPERSEASRMAVRLRVQAEADTLVARGSRQRVDYTAEITAAGDSALFKAAMKSGIGTVLGPDSVAGGWQVVRVNAVMPGRSRPFEEVRDLVERAWGDAEGERRMQELLASLRQRANIVVNRAPLEKLAASAPGQTSGKAP